MEIILDGTPFTEGMTGGGVHRYTSNLLLDLPKNGVNVHILGSRLHDIPEGDTSPTVFEPRVRENHRFSNGAKKINWMLESISDRLFGLRSGPWRLYHSIYYRTPETSLPMVTTFHDALMVRFPQLFSSSYCDRVRRMQCNSLNRADKVICVSKSSLRDCIELFNITPEKCEVIPLAATCLPEEAPDSSSAKASKFSENGDSPFLLFVGSRYAHKNFPRLLKAFSALPKGIEANLLVVGGPPEWSREESELLFRLGIATRVRKLGRIKDTQLYDLYRDSICCVMPSLYEGFGLPVLEALGNGGLVACSNVSSLPEAGGNAAFYFDPEDTDSIIYTLTKVIALSEKDRDERRALGRVHASQFSWSRVAAETADVYRRLLA